MEFVGRPTGGGANRQSSDMRAEVKGAGRGRGLVHSTNMHALQQMYRPGFAGMPEREGMPDLIIELGRSLGIRQSGRPRKA